MSIEELEMLVADCEALSTDYENLSQGQTQAEMVRARLSLAYYLGARCAAFPPLGGDQAGASERTYSYDELAQLTWADIDLHCGPQRDHHRIKLTFRKTNQADPTKGASVSPLLSDAAAR
jgi:hypothetical protein